MRHALQEAARRSEGSQHRRSEAGDSVHSNGSGGDSVRDGMSFRQVRPRHARPGEFKGVHHPSGRDLQGGAAGDAHASFARKAVQRRETAAPALRCLATCALSGVLTRTRNPPALPAPQFLRMLRAGSTDCLELYDDRHGSYGSYGSLGSLGQARWGGRGILQGRHPASAAPVCQGCTCAAHAWGRPPGASQG